MAKSQSEGLQNHLGNMVEGLLKWQDDTTNHFKAKVSVCVLINFAEMLDFIELLGEKMYLSHTCYLILIICL